MTVGEVAGAGLGVISSTPGTLALYSLDAAGAVSEYGDWKKFKDMDPMLKKMSKFEKFGAGVTVLLLVTEMSFDAYDVSQGKGVFNKTETRKLNFLKDCDEGKIESLDEFGACPKIFSETPLYKVQKLAEQIDIILEETDEKAFEYANEEHEQHEIRMEFLEEKIKTTRDIRKIYEARYQELSAQQKEEVQKEYDKIMAAELDFDEDAYIESITPDDEEKDIHYYMPWIAIATLIGLKVFI
tara:strand:+ start:10837 stop:11559 length:723 start_codon:yes stop_codon:yes gene_type:complete